MTQLNLPYCENTGNNRVSLFDIRMEMESCTTIEEVEAIYEKHKDRINELTPKVRKGFEGMYEAIRIRIVTKGKIKTRKQKYFR